MILLLSKKKFILCWKKKRTMLPQKTIFKKSAGKKNNKTKVIYVVGSGKRPGIYGTWAECQSQVIGFKNSAFRKFEDLQEAKNYAIAYDLEFDETKAKRILNLESPDKDSTPSSALSKHSFISGIDISLEKPAVVTTLKPQPEVADVNFNIIDIIESSDDFFDRLKQLVMTTIFNYFHFEIWTDGSCKPNPGNGGYAALIILTLKNNNNLNIKEQQILKTHLYGSQNNTTNQIMETFAVLQSCAFVQECLKKVENIMLEHKRIDVDIVYHIDCRAVLDGCRSDVLRWQKKGFPNANPELWKKMYELVYDREKTYFYTAHLRYNVSFKWNHVKAHAENFGNNYVDRLANAQVQKQK